MATTGDAPSLDPAAVARWPLRASAHLLGIGLVATVLVALPVAPTDLDRHQLPKETVAHLATWLAIILARPFPLRLPGRALGWGLALLIGVSALSGALATNPWLAWRGLSLTITLIAAFLAARHAALLGAGGILSGWCIAAAACGVGSGLAQAYGLDSPFFADTRAPGGTFGNRNFLAHFCALALPLVVLPTLTTRRRLAALGGMALATALLTAIVLTRSRAAWLGGFVGGMMLLLALYRARPLGLPVVRGRILRLGLAFGLGLGLAVALPNALEWRSRSPYSDTLAGLANHQEGSGRGRLLQYRHSLELALRHPLLGVGPGNWPIRYGETAPPNDPSWVPGDVIPLNPWPSSDWIALISERGPLALAAVLLIGLALAWRAWRGIGSGGDRALAGAGLAAMLATFCVEGTFDAVALLAAPGDLLALGAGMLLCRADGIPVGEPLERPPAPRWSLVLPMVLALVTLRSVMQTSSYLVAGDGRDRSRLVLAARIDPGSYALRIALANKGSCKDARAALKLAPLWPAPKAAARRCGGSR